MTEVTPSNNNVVPLPKTNLCIEIPMAEIPVSSDNVVNFLSDVHKTPKCPVCGMNAQYLTWERDRDLHPSIWIARYSCGLYDHVIASPWADVGLGGTADDPKLEQAARREWFTMMNQILNPDDGNTAA